MKRITARSLLLALAAVWLAGCWNRIDQPANPADQPVVKIALGSEFQLKAGQKAILNDNEVIVSFARIDQDSRCPKDVVCIQAGQVTAVMRLVVAGEGLGDVKLTLVSGPQAQVKGYTLTLKAIDPYPVSTAPIKPMDYAATLVLSR